MRAYTRDPLISPVSTFQLAEWLRLDGTSDPLLNGLITAATQVTIDWLQRDLIARDWVLVHECWPMRNRNLTSHQSSQYYRTVELPYGGALSIADVTVYGELVPSADYRITDELPSSIRFMQGAYPVLTDYESPALTVNYRAGFGETQGDVPSAIHTAILMMAGYMYAHRGACEAAQALTMSGASTLLQPFRVRAGITL
jgi:uncharacterized phiE125 gp8 family phage protein